MAGHPRVLIVGAGLGGIMAGRALLRGDLDVAIFEQAGDIRDIQLATGLALWPNGIRALQAVGAVENAESQETPARVWIRHNLIVSFLFPMAIRSKYSELTKWVGEFGESTIGAKAA